VIALRDFSVLSTVATFRKMFVLLHTSVSLLLRQVSSKLKEKLSIIFFTYNSMYSISKYICIRRSGIYANREEWPEVISATCRIKWMSKWQKHSSDRSGDTSGGSLWRHYRRLDISQHRAKWCKRAAGGG